MPIEKMMDLLKVAIPEPAGITEMRFRRYTAHPSELTIIKSIPSVNGFRLRFYYPYNFSAGIPISPGP